MKSLPTIHNQGPELRADSREVAKFFEVQHENLRGLIEKNRVAFESFGILRFETGVIKGRGQPEKFCYLTEAQVAFLLTLTRNTGRTTELKLALIQQFQRVRVQLRPVDNILLSIPDGWKTIFTEDFYRALLKLYGYEFTPGVVTPQWVAGFTNKYIYGPLWEKLPTELKTKRKALLDSGESTAEFLKLHRFLEENAKKALERHILTITTLLEVSTEPDHFRELFAAKFNGETQLFIKVFNQKKAA